MIPKVFGATKLDEATKDLDLDFFVLFSSEAGAFGNIGQADYATANAFMDQFAHHRDKQVLSNDRRGQTLSINWPLWKEGGMKADSSTEEMMYHFTGMAALETEAGIRSFYQGLALKQAQFMVMTGHVSRLRTLLSESISKQEASRTQVIPESVGGPGAVNPSKLREKATDLIKGLLASTLKIAVHRLRTDEPMEKYGIDSVLAMAMTQQLEKTFGSLSKTLFFEYQTIDELSRYFIDSHGKELKTILRQIGRASCRERV